MGRVFTATELAEASGVDLARIYFILSGLDGFLDQGLVEEVAGGIYRVTRRGLALSRGLSIAAPELATAERGEARTAPHPPPPQPTLLDANRSDREE